MKLASILKGTKIAYDAIQSIKGLTIVPLTCDPQYSLDDKYSSPFAHNVSTTNYGTLHVHRDPTDNKTLIVPPHSTYITKYAAQDHLISKGVLMKKGSPRRTLSDSRCVESTQGGFIRPTGNNMMVIAPMVLRESAYKHVGASGYSALWGDIANFNRAHNSGSRQQIKDYYSKWNKELDEFIAHFERLDNCIGFITLYEDEVVAIDKFPSFTYTSEIWDKLVRDSYASLVIKDKVINKSASTALEKVSDMDKRMTVRNIYNALVGKRNDHYKLLMQEIVDIDFAEKNDADTPGSKILSANGYIGQVIDDNGINVLVSIIKKDHFDPTKLRDAREVRRLARGQEDFEL